MEFRAEQCTPTLFRVCTMPCGGLPLRRELLLVLLLTVLTAKGAPSTPKSFGQNIDSRSMSGAVDFLIKYGYLAEPDLERGYLRTEEELQSAIREMQRYAGLEATGVVDERTLQMMQMKRCGVPDLVGTSERVRRYVLQGSKWSTTKLTWSIDKPSKHLSYEATSRELIQAFQMWSESSRLEFQQLHRGSPSDLSIAFVVGFHGDGYTFDGPGAALAHTFFPGPGLGGDTHFDDDGSWVATQNENSSGVSLFAVAAHQFGHSLGLSHSRNVKALMYPYYQQIGPGYTLSEDDRMGIEQLYGAKEEDLTRSPPLPGSTRQPYTRWTVPGAISSTITAPTKRPHKPKPPPPTCDTSYDAISVIRGELFIFKDTYFWRLNDHGLLKIYPVLIERFWRDFPQDLKRVDALYERPKDRKIVFFIGTKYYLFDSTQLVHGYPKPLTNLGLPPDVKHIDAAMVWGHNGKTYLFSGERYWRFDETDGHVELDYPRNMAEMWKGVPYHIDSAFKGPDGSAYFFKDKGFWKFNDQKMRVENDDPLSSAAYWMGCPKPSSSVKDQHNETTGFDSIVPTTSVLHQPSQLVVTLWEKFRHLLQQYFAKKIVAIFS